MKKIKSLFFFLLTIAVLLLVLFMVFGSIILFMGFGANKESLTFLAVTVVICIPGIVYLTKVVKKSVGLH